MQYIQEFTYYLIDIKKAPKGLTLGAVRRKNI